MYIEIERQRGRNLKWRHLYFFRVAVKALGKRKEKQASAAGEGWVWGRGASLCSEVRAVLIPKWILEQTSERGK